jgi:hypothetical protein
VLPSLLNNLIYYQMAELIKDISSKYYSTVLGDLDGKADASIHIGSQDKFVPNINASKWDDEAWINLNYKAMSVATEKESLSDGTASLKVGGVTFKTWPLNNNVLECSLTFDSKNDVPVNNKLMFEIKDSGNLSYYYQPPLTQKEIDEGSERPDNVIGSYAVYFNKRNNQYKTGKFCHIYRWHFVDKNGKTKWCDRLYIENGELIIPVPDLSNMVFPVYGMGAGDTLGYDSIGGTFGNYSTAGSVFTASASGTLDGTGKLYLNNDNAGSQDIDIEISVYDDNSGTPVGGDLVSTCTSTVTTLGAWASGWSNDVSGLSGSITNGNDYWLLFDTPDSNIRGKYDAGTDRGFASYIGSYGSWPDPGSWGEPTITAMIWSVYVDYTPSGGTSVAPTTLPPTSLAPTSLAPTTLTPTTLEPTTLPPTTLAPTTLEPTTTAPTTLPPTTLAPTTLEPTTIAPTTPEPTTLAPTTIEPTTLLPTTLAPTTLEPTTLPPTTIIVTTQAPTTLPPTSLAPTTLEPTTLSPTTLEPTTLPPTTLAPTTLEPTTLPPTTLEPTTLPPTTVAPTTLAPTTLEPTTLAATTLAPTTLPPTTLFHTTVAPTTLFHTTLAPTTIITTTLAPTTPGPFAARRRGIKDFGFSFRDRWRN